MNIEKMTLKNREKYLESLEEKLFLKNEDYMNSLDEDPSGLSEKTKTLETEIQKLSYLINKIKKANAIEKMSLSKEEDEEILLSDDEEPTERLDDVVEKVQQKLKEEEKNMDVEIEELASHNKIMIYDPDVAKKQLEDSITVELPKQIKPKVSNIKIFFDGKSGLYKINYIKDGENTTDLVMIDSNVLNYDQTNPLYSKVSREYGNEIADKIDYNLYNLLGNFDKKNSTFLQTDYINGTLTNNVTYDLRGFNKLRSEIVNKEVKGKIKQIVNKQKEKRNTNIIRFDNRKVAALFIAGSVLAGITSLSSLKNKSKINSLSNNIDTVSYNKGIEEKGNNVLNKGIKVDVEKNIVETTVIKNEKEKNNNQLFLNQDLYLNDDVTFYYDCYENGPSVKVNQLNCDFFRISKVAVIIDGIFKEFYEMPENETISIDEVKEMYEKQFPDSVIEFSALSNGYIKDNPTPIYKGIGYSKTNNLKTKNQELNKHSNSL